MPELDIVNLDQAIEFWPPLVDKPPFVRKKRHGDYAGRQSDVILAVRDGEVPLDSAASGILTMYEWGDPTYMYWSIFHQGQHWIVRQMTNKNLGVFYKRWLGVKESLDDAPIAFAVTDDPKIIESRLITRNPSPLPDLKEKDGSSRLLPELNTPAVARAGTVQDSETEFCHTTSSPTDSDTEAESFTTAPTGRTRVPKPPLLKYSGYRHSATGIPDIRTADSNDHDKAAAGQPPPSHHMTPISAVSDGTSDHESIANSRPLSASLANLLMRRRRRPLSPASTHHSPQYLTCPRRHQSPLSTPNPLTTEKRRRIHHSPLNIPKQLSSFIEDKPFGLDLPSEHLTGEDTPDRFRDQHIALLRAAVEVTARRVEHAEMDYKLKRKEYEMLIGMEEEERVQRP